MTQDVLSTPRAGRRLRVAIFHTLPPGGARRALFELVRRSSASVEYHLHEVDLGRAERWPHLVGHQALGPFVHTVTRHRLVAAPRLGPIARVADIETMQLLQRRLARVLDAGRYDAILVSHEQFTSSPSILRWLRTPTVYLCQEPRRRSFEAEAAGPHMSGPLGPAARSYERVLRRRDIEAARAAGTLVTNSRYTAGYVSRAYGRGALVCHLGVDETVLRSAEPSRPRRNTVLSVGALDPAKGHDLVVEALGRVPRSARPALDIVHERGHDDVAVELRARASALGVDITFHRAVPDTRLAELYASARATVCAARLEPFGLTAIESLSCGTPVVAVSEGGFPEAVVDGVHGRLVPRDAAHLAAAITDVLNHPPAEAGELRRSVLPYWSWDSAAGRFVAILHGALAGSHVPRPAGVAA